MAQIQRTWCFTGCGNQANGPHPDPEISYRQPLCGLCRAKVQDRMDELQVEIDADWFEQWLDEGSN